MDEGEGGDELMGDEVGGGGEEEEEEEKKQPLYEGKEGGWYE